MTDACRKNRVQFMDGVMFMHNPRLARVREDSRRRQKCRSAAPDLVGLQFFGHR